MSDPRAALIGLKNILLSVESNASGNPEWEAVSRKLRPAFQCIPHMHVGPSETCGRCGLNLRDDIHERLSVIPASLRPPPSSTPSPP